MYEIKLINPLKQFGKYNWIEQWERIYELKEPYSDKPEIYCDSLKEDKFNTANLEWRKELFMKQPVFELMGPVTFFLNGNETFMNSIKAFSVAPNEIKNDRKTVLEIVRNYGPSLQYASDRLRDDRDVVLAAVKNYWLALGHASERLRDDKDVVLAAVKKCGITLRDASERLKDDRDIVLAAVSQNGEALKYASKRLREDRDIALIAIKQTRSAYYVLSAKLQGDPEIRKLVGYR